MQLYTEDGMEIPKGWEGRNKNPMQRLVGEFGGKFEKLKRAARTVIEETVDNAQETITKPSGSKWQKVGAYIALGAVAVLGGGIYIYKRSRTQNADNTAQHRKYDRAA